MSSGEGCRLCNVTTSQTDNQSIDRDLDSSTKGSVQRCKQGFALSCPRTNDLFTLGLVLGNTNQGPQAGNCPFPLAPSYRLEWMGCRLLIRLPICIPTRLDQLPHYHWQMSCHLAASDAESPCKPGRWPASTPAGLPARRALLQVSPACRALLQVSPAC
jgi:hypothetical protein